MRDIAVFVVSILFLILLMGIFYFMPVESVWIALGALAVIVIFHFLSRMFRGKQFHESRPSQWQNLTSLLVIFVLIFIIFVGTLWEVVPSALSYVLMVSLVFTMLINFLTVPLAIFHKIKQKKEVFQPSSYKPRVSIIVPAFNEEKVLARTLETLIEADYPDKEIIVVDDGSKDNTYSIASEFSRRG